MLFRSDLQHHTVAPGALESVGLELARELETLTHLLFRVTLAVLPALGVVAKGLLHGETWRKLLRWKLHELEEPRVESDGIELGIHHADALTHVLHRHLKERGLLGELCLAPF